MMLPTTISRDDGRDSMILPPGPPAHSPDELMARYPAAPSVESARHLVGRHNFPLHP
jgi:hypothetical protein